MISTPNQHRILKRIPCAVLVLFFWIALISFASASANALDQAPTDFFLENDSCDAQNSASEKIQIAQSPEASLKNSAPCLMARIRIVSDQKSNETLVELQINIRNRTWAYFCARYYHAQLGRFISRDPLGFVDGMSLYRGYFVLGAVDPSGLACHDPCEGRWKTITISVFDLVENKNIEITRADIEADIVTANEIFKKCCVKIELDNAWNIHVPVSLVDTTRRTREIEYESLDFEGKPIHAENANDAIEYFKTPNDVKKFALRAEELNGKGIKVFYVKHIEHNIGVRGVSFGTFSEFTPRIRDGKAWKPHTLFEYPSYGLPKIPFTHHPAFRSVFVRHSNLLPRGNVLAHELFHNVTGFGTHIADKNNLMSTAAGNSLVEFQCKALRGENWDGASIK